MEQLFRENIQIKESEIRFGIKIPVFPTVQLEEESFSSKEKFISILKEKMLEEVNKTIYRMFRDDITGDFDNLIPYWWVNEFEVEDYETGETSDILGEYKKDNKNFFENILLSKLTKIENEEF